MSRLPGFQFRLIRFGAGGVLNLSQRLVVAYVLNLLGLPIWANYAVVHLESALFGFYYHSRFTFRVERSVRRFGGFVSSVLILKITDYTLVVLASKLPVVERWVRRHPWLGDTAADNLFFVTIVASSVMLFFVRYVLLSRLAFSPSAAPSTRVRLQHARPVFILSTGRTGTMALARYFDDLPGVRAHHEPPPSRGLRISSNRYLCRKLSSQQLRDELFTARRHLEGGMTDTIYVEVNPFLCGFVDVLDDVFEAPRVVHIVRDPRTYIPSHLNHGGLRGLKGAAARYWPYWMLKPEDYDNAPADTWNRMSDKERMAWRWQAINGALNRGEKILNERYKRIRFEDLFNPSGQNLRQLVDWIGSDGVPLNIRPLHRQKLNASRVTYCDPWELWPEPERRDVLTLCGRDLLDLYGYGWSKRHP